MSKTPITAEEAERYRTAYAVLAGGVDRLIHDYGKHWWWPTRRGMVAQRLDALFGEAGGSCSHPTVPRALPPRDETKEDGR